MIESPRKKLLSVCIGVALMQMAGSAMADSATGADTVIGNSRNPGYATGPVYTDPDLPDAKRTPSGQMYNVPPLKDAEVDGAVTGYVEFGAITSSNKDRHAKLDEYSDVQKNGMYINNFGLSTSNADSAYYLRLNGGAPGRDDQFYDLLVGQYNSWRVKGFYNQTPHVFSTTFRPLWINNGTDTPTLNNGANGAAVVAGTCSVNGVVQVASSACSILNYLTSQPFTEVGLIRKKGGARFDVKLADGVSAYASFTHEKREGERPFGIQGGANPQVNPEGIEPISYVTNELLGGLQYSDELNAANLRASLSTFSNDIDTLNVQKAHMANNTAPTSFFLAASPTGMNFNRYVLSPDNKAWNVKGELSRRLPDFFNSRLSADISLGESTQDDKIQTPLRPNDANFSSASIVQAAANGVTFDANNWNGVNGSPTSRATSGQKIATELFNVLLNMQPMDDLTVKANFRHYATKNKSGIYYAYNPLTGQWGYGVQEEVFNTFAPLAVGGTGCQPAPGFTLPVGSTCTGLAYGTTVAASGAFANTRDFSNRPRDYKQDNIVLSGDYSLDGGSIEAAIERENFTHTYRERDKTWEDKLRLGYVNTSMDTVTLRASFETDRKRGSFYDALVTTRGGVNWFSVYGLEYSREALKALIAANVTASATEYRPTVAAIQNWILLNGNYNIGGMQKTDQADRDQNILNLRANFMPADNLDVGAYMQIKKVKYPTNASNRGVQRDDLNTFSLDTNYQVAEGTHLTAYYTRQDGKQRQVENFGMVGANAAARMAASIARLTPICGAVLTVDNIDCMLNEQLDPAFDASVETRSTNDTLGLGIEQDIGDMKLGIDYTFALGRSAIANAYSSSALTIAALNQGVVTQFGSDWPTMYTRQHSLGANLLIPISKQMTARVSYYYDYLKLGDWHYDYMSVTAPVTYIPSDMGPTNYHANSLGVFLNYKM